MTKPYMCRVHGELAPEAIYTWRNRRYCRTCHVEYARRWRVNPDFAKAQRPPGTVCVCHVHGPLTSDAVTYYTRKNGARQARCAACRRNRNGHGYPVPLGNGIVYRCRKHGPLGLGGVRRWKANRMACDACVRERGGFEKLRTSENELRRHARRMTSVAIASGLLTRPSACEECHCECKPEAAHTDYARPLEVRWLCRSCHTRYDATRDRSALLAA